MKMHFEMMKNKKYCEEVELVFPMEVKEPNQYPKTLIRNNVISGSPMMTPANSMKHPPVVLIEDVPYWGHQSKLAVMERK